jgi:N-dimethylarginine dimethylaminohydrolase
VSVPVPPQTRGALPVRTATARHYLMCPPEHFAVSYAINPWMVAGCAVDRATAKAQWSELRSTYEGLGHRVDVVAPVAGLPDMVFAANGGLVVGGRAVSARFRYAERTGEEQPYHDALTDLGVRDVRRPAHVSEGEGDFLVVGPDSRLVLAGTGFRTTPEAHAEVAVALDAEVVPLELVDPRFYHLDTALTVLTEDAVAVYPDAFSAPALAEIRRRFSTVVAVGEQDAVVLGLNAVSDGRSVVLEAAATAYAAQLRALGFQPVGVDMSELRKAGGAVKCCTMELRGVPALQPA